MQYHILSFDPGLSFSGWSYNLVEDNSKIFTVEDFGMITPNKTIGHKEYRDVVSKYGSRIITLNLLRDMIRVLMNKYKPDFVASEDAFFNPRRPNAYEALVHWILMVSIVLKDDYSKPLIKIPPKLVKRFISGTGTSNKDSVQSAIFNHTDIVINKSVIDGELSEHEGDAIAIGYSSWLILKSNNIVKE